VDGIVHLLKPFRLNFLQLTLGANLAVLALLANHSDPNQFLGNMLSLFFFLLGSMLIMKSWRLWLYDAIFLSYESKWKRRENWS
jgi:hypothetical protein